MAWFRRREEREPSELERRLERMSTDAVVAGCEQTLNEVGRGLMVWRQQRAPEGASEAARQAELLAVYTKELARRGDQASPDPAEDALAQVRAEYAQRADR